MSIIRPVMFMLLATGLAIGVASTAVAQTVAPAFKPVKKAATTAEPAPESPAKPGEAAHAPRSDAESAEKLRLAAQNPVANLISVPFQNNTNFDTGPYNRPQNVLNIQPVVPVKITPEWNLITRWVTPLI